MSDFTTLLLSIKENTQYIVINRPDKLNALNRDTLNELRIALKQGIKDPAVKGMILTGAGEKAFIAGADIREFTELDPEKAASLAADVQSNICNLIENSPKPIVAALNGFTLGGGLELAMSCHIRVASDTAKLGLPELSLGIIPGYGGTQRLPQLVGRGKALEMILTGDLIPADEALKIGLVNQVVRQGDLLDACQQILAKIAKRAPLAIAAAIAAVNAGMSSYERGFQTEISGFSKLFASQDMKEGVAAFLEKRPANFKGA